MLLLRVEQENYQAYLLNPIKMFSSLIPISVVPKADIISVFAMDMVPMVIWYLALSRLIFQVNFSQIFLPSNSLSKENLEVVYKAARHNDQSHVADIFKQGMAKTNRQLVSSYIDVHHSGTTVVGVLIFENHLWCANVGDSRAVLLKLRNNHWSVVPLSYDHKPDIPSEKERILRCGGRVEQMKGYNGVPVGPQRVWLKNEDTPGLAMSRSMGDTLAEKVGKTAEAGKFCERRIFVNSHF